MRHTSVLKSVMLGAVCLLGIQTAQAGTVETLDGSVIQGKILGIDAGTIKIETSFAGVIEISQTEVKNFASDETIHVSTSDGNTFVGPVSSSGKQLNIKSSAGTLTTSVANVSAAWLPGEDSPATRAMKAEIESKQRKWSFQAGADITGKSGNSDSFGTALNFKATLASDFDKLVFYAGMNYEEQNDTTSAEEYRAGVDYSSFFSDRMTWYARIGLTKDEIAGLNFGSIAAAGIGYHLIKKDDQTLIVRGGLSYRYEDYEPGADTDSPGLDLALIHEKDFTFGSLVNMLSFNPNFDDFGDYRFYHESALEMPLGTSEFWKMRIGISNDYNSEPAPGKKSMDTTYFTRLILTWE